ncbi:MAG: hypothetical protein PHO74_09205, partial [Weeksellaceae bacterium]|nr:hypothetical protein [Weeksellaceae bacterium]
RLSESPVFLPKAFKDKLIEVSSSIIEQIKSMKEDELAKAIPENHKVPKDTEKPHFIAIDFGICKDEKGEISPELIELQAFPSLFSLKKLYEQMLLETYPFLNQIKHPYTVESYFNKLDEVILAGEKPENVILMEIHPEKQKTLADFLATQKMLGIPIVNLTDVKKSGNELYYEKDGKSIPIHRIYNRVIFDEIDKIPNLKTHFDFRDELDVEWVTHPNWFFKISKYLLPKLKHQYIPESFFLSDFPQDENLNEFVLKPLFSFAGSGIELNPTKQKINQIRNPENFIMQRKVSYEPLFEDSRGEFSKAEIRMLFLWNPKDENPEWVINLVRMTKAAMVNVDFNRKDAIWIGSSMAFFEN